MRNQDERDFTVSKVGDNVDGRLIVQCKACGRSGVEERRGSDRVIVHKTRMAPIEALGDVRLEERYDACKHSPDGGQDQ